MQCAWQDFLYLVPHKIRNQVDLMGRASLQELRLRVNQPPELVLSGGSKWLSEKIGREELNFVINAASNYSPWTAASMAEGFITAAGGHRIGICGQAVIHNQVMTSIANPTSLCMRVARDYPGISAGVEDLNCSILIIGSPGAGKTTLLRDLIRRYANADLGAIGVVDSRGELFGDRKNTGFETGKRMDVLVGCTKAEGMERILRTMGPACIAVDEITAEADIRAILSAAWNGVHLFATAHAGSMEEFRARKLYEPLLSNRIFSRVIIMSRDKSWREEIIRYEH